MKIKVWGDPDRIAELLERDWAGHELDIHPETRREELSLFDLFIDLSFDQNTSYWQDLYRQLSDKPVLINTLQTELTWLYAHSVAKNPLYFGLNAWPGFIKRPVMELTVGNEKHQSELTFWMQCLGWNYEVVKDKAGMVSARVVAMIINEAYFTLQDGTATKADIDKAMKLGTHHPYGPFEWSERIGSENIFRLLLQLYKETRDERYLPSALLEKEAQQKKQ